MPGKVMSSAWNLDIKKCYNESSLIHHSHSYISQFITETQFMHDTPQYNVYSVWTEIQPR